MQPFESDSTEVACVVTGGDAPKSSYEAVRYNAMSHGILARLAVLPHEDGDEFAELLAALVEEHAPGGMTERHLVEELAAIIWRKRRVLMAEGARINEGLKNVVNSPTLVMPAAVPFEHGLTGGHLDLSNLVTASAEDISERQRTAALDLAATRKAAAILRKGGANAYEKARRALLRDSRDWWDDYVQEEEYGATAEGLTQFIRKELEPMCIRVAQESRFVTAIKAQTLGEGLQAQRLEKLNRYETHLDRKFERTLSMLLKLKELRGG